VLVDRAQGIWPVVASGAILSGMSAPAKPQQPTMLEELLAQPEESRFEIVAGELVPKDAASARHGHAQGRTIEGLRAFNRRPGGDQPGGWWFVTEALVMFAPGEVYRPDVAGWRRERLPELPDQVPIEVRPDWVCEIVSPTSARRDRVRKMRVYHAAGVPHYWLVDPQDETLMVYRWTPEGYLYALGATREDRVRAEPFDAIELQVGALFGDDEGE